MLFHHTIKIAATINGMGVLYCEAVCNHTHVLRAAVMFRAYAHKPHVVYIPDIYAGYLHFIYDELDDSRTLIVSKKR